MTLKQAFVASFYFLSFYYEEAKDESLLDIISSMNPHVWVDGNSFDPASEHDWERIAKSIVKEGCLSSQQAFKAMYEYVKFFKTEFGFDFDWVLEGLLEKTHNDAKWIECVETAINTKQFE